MVKILKLIAKIVTTPLDHKTTILTILCMVLGIALGYVWQDYQGLKSDNERLKVNQEALTSEVETFKTKSGLDASRVTELELTKSEFEKICADQAAEIKDLGIKLKRLQSVSSVGTSTDFNFVAPIHDTIRVYLKDTVAVKESIRSFVWSDPWNKVEGIIKEDSVACRYSGQDTITIAAAKVPKRFLWVFKYGVKKIDVSVKSSNPSNTITYNKSVSLK